MFLFNTKLIINKKLNHSLISIYGLGLTNLNVIFKKLGFSINLKTKELTKNQIFKLLKIINNLNILLSYSLKKYKISILEKFNYIKCLKSLRFFKKLPVRGQRTRTNAKTARKFNFF